MEGFHRALAREDELIGQQEKEMFELLRQELEILAQSSRHDEHLSERDVQESVDKSQGGVGSNSPLPEATPSSTAAVETIVAATALVLDVPWETKVPNRGQGKPMSLDDVKRDWETVQSLRKRVVELESSLDSSEDLLSSCTDEVHRKQAALALDSMLERPSR